MNPLSTSPKTHQENQPPHRPPSVSPKAAILPLFHHTAGELIYFAGRFFLFNLGGFSLNFGLLIINKERK